MNRPPEFHEKAEFEIFAKDGLLSLTISAGKKSISFTMPAEDAAAMGKALTEAVAQMPDGGE